MCEHLNNYTKLRIEDAYNGKPLIKKVMLICKDCKVELIVDFVKYNPETGLQNVHYENLVLKRKIKE